MAEAQVTSIKGLLSDADETFDASGLGVLIVHARWNIAVVSALVEGAIQELKAAGVKEGNIVVETVPGSYELPWACARLIAAGRRVGRQNAEFSAVIAIGALIKGSTMHFEYICEAVSQGLMRVTLDTGVPVIFGVLACLTEEQAQQRAGLLEGSHNHGCDWGRAAVEGACKARRWADGAF